MQAVLPAPPPPGIPPEGRRAAGRWFRCPAVHSRCLDGRSAPRARDLPLVTFSAWTNDHRAHGPCDAPARPYHGGRLDGGGQAMTFDPNARLDPGQITDRRGMGGRGGLAVGGGGLGIVVLLVYMLLGGNPNDLGGALLDPGRRDRPRRAPPSRPTARPARTPIRATTAGSSATSTACRRTGPTPSPAPARPTSRSTPSCSPTPPRRGCGTGERGQRAVLLPDRPARLPRPRLLRRAADPASAPPAGRSPRAT